MIAVLGDTHGDFEIINRIVRGCRDRGFGISTVIQVGDFGAFMDHPPFLKLWDGDVKFDVPVKAIPGNHEEQDTWDYLVRNQNKIHNFQALKNHERFEVAGISFYPLGSAENVDGQPPGKHYPCYTDSDIETILLQDFQTNPVDVFITHEAPRAAGLMGHPLFAHLGIPGDTRLDKVLRYMRPKYQFHGHHHKKKVTPFEGTEIISLHVAQHGFALLDPETKTYSLMGVY